VDTLNRPGDRTVLQLSNNSGTKSCEAMYSEQFELFRNGL